MALQPFNPGNGHGSQRPSIVPFPEDRLPPQNIEAEQGVLGAILLDNDVLHDVVAILKAEDFWRDSHQIIYRVIRDCYDAGKPVDALLLDEELKKRGESERIGGLEAISELVNRVPHAANAKYHAGIVREKAIARNLISAVREISEQGFSNTVTSDTLIENAEKKIFAIAEDSATGETKALSEILTDAMNRIEMRASDKHAVTGVSSGFYELDEMTNGFSPGQLIIVAARPSMGKTAFALNICEHVAVDQGAGVLFVSLEMGESELAERILTAKSRVDFDKIRKGHLGYREMKMLGEGFDALNAAPIWIDDTPARNMIQIAANARRLSMRNKGEKSLSLIVVDYIQLVDAEGEGRESRQEQIAKVSRRLKNLARDLKVPVIALSQLNRNVENREDRRPRLADLRESGAIEQDADVVLMLHRPEYYDANDQPGIALCIVHKNRNGATGEVKLTWLKNITRFENLATVNDPIDGGAF